MTAKGGDHFRFAVSRDGRNWTEVGEQMNGVRYRLLSDSMFELRAAVNGGDVVLRSNESRQAFLGNSISVVAGHSR